MALAHFELRDFERVAHLWYDDGNVILVARGRGFRVHRGVLMQRSPGFRGLFLPLSSNYCSAGACPILRLPKDPLHLELVLSALYDRFFFGDLDVYHEIPEVASGIISLAHKYDFRILHDEAIHRLSEAGHIRHCSKDNPS
ncbi:uncharacterized protein LAESUDRAFT_117362 [Laetiporus sulphureus 93-53]|uniref:BTB domain-containing protein n=1 Tax=Laetiporus sulphureus 93-53 TaxID=1314785 RepID=A0A165EJA8_9APHY|nr:uncharacterized protein LAESUDRAFT_117362 [Laetiporus sulphureus 93-53]KZT07168.1 hypothetical protein LAESUDRAFT_117362 [Laetiporus sulphureus 93-53]